MKHNTHIYIAMKSIQCMYDALANLRYRSGQPASAEKRKKAREAGKILQRLLYFHRADVTEASWAPDDILKDMALFHTFKLFTADEFTEAIDDNISVWACMLEK